MLIELTPQSMTLISDSQTAPAFILGLGPNGYGHARSLARVGVPAVGFYYSHQHFGRFSRMLPDGRHYRPPIMVSGRQAPSRPVLYRFPKYFLYARQTNGRN